jgi:hypothetical protein
MGGTDLTADSQPCHQEHPIDADMITADLWSGDPARVTRALAELDQHRPPRERVAIAMPPADCLTTFGDELTEETVDRFIRVVYGFFPFEPPEELFGRHTTALDAVMLYGPGQPAFDVAMWIRVDGNADDATKAVMRHLSTYLTENDAAVEELIAPLLDGDTTHDAAVEGLARWAFYDVYPRLVDSFLPRLTPAERQRLLDERAVGR